MIVVLLYRLARRQHAWLLSTSIAIAPEAGSVQIGRPARAHARSQSKSAIAVDMPPAAAACDRRRGGAGCILTSAPRCNTWVRDRENLREISRCAHLEGEEVTYGRSAPARTPADHPWLSQGSSQAKTIKKWALVREKVALRLRPPLRTRAGEATQRALIVAGRREAPLEASTGGAEAAILLSPRTVKRRVGLKGT